MTLVYRTNGAWGAGKGAPLTSAEGDNNIYQLNTRLTTVEGSIPSAAKGITSITASGTLMTITYTDLTTQSITLPLATYTYRGIWLPSTAYAVRDQFTHNGSFYQVLVAHTSALTFDPFATNGLGQDLYALLMSNPGSSLPTGGSTDMVLGKVDGTDFNMSWRQSGMPRAGANNALLAKNSTTDYDTHWVTQASLTFPFSQLSGSIASSQLPFPGPTTKGAVLSATPVASEWVTGVSTSGVFTTLQPDYVDLTGVPPHELLAFGVSGVFWASSVTLDVDNSNIFEITPAGATTITMGNQFAAGKIAMLYVLTSGTTSYTLTFGTGIISQGTVTTGTTTAKRFVISFFCDNIGNWVEFSRIGPF